ncbi:transcriptional regulator [Desulfotignum phosphitoxidans DSM 13687]|uniref:Transcriptional regulator n=1 Tax=Desulfotignum phosphitoxidans DSM 13687 TaxID=1286635 RepID=S0FYG9_9BACT|nr:transcriptional regulator [Desulfotignum phosphitoxidans DSM 13687]
MDILSGKIPGGTRLVETVLAKEKGVSRTPVREALQQLAKEELLYAIPRAGYIVQSLSESDIMDLFETRMAIEHVAGQKAINNITDAELTQLKNNLNISKAAIDKDSTIDMPNYDIEFHEIIYKATRSKYLYRICMMLSDYTLKFRQSIIIYPEVAQRALKDHNQIYQAFKKKSPEKLDKAINSHLKVVKKDILESLSKLRQESFL